MKRNPYSRWWAASVLSGLVMISSGCSSMQTKQGGWCLSHEPSDEGRWLELVNAAPDEIGREQIALFEDDNGVLWGDRIFWRVTLKYPGRLEREAAKLLTDLENDAKERSGKGDSPLYLGRRC